MGKTPVKLASDLTGLKGEELAERLGVSAPHVSRLKTGKSPTTTDHIKKLAEICNVSEQEFYSLLAGDLDVRPGAGNFAGVAADEPLLVESELFELAFEEARNLDQRYANGHAKSSSVKRLLYAIYRFIEETKSVEN